jgi:hypothetical protein
VTQESPQPSVLDEPPPGAVLIGFSEMALIDAYREAVKGGLASLNGVADKVLTATFALATALAAVIGLVAPKDQPTSLWIVAPFALFAAAALAALVGLLFSVKPADRPTSDQTTEPLKRVLLKKQISVAAAVVFLVLGTGGAIGVLIDSYGPGVDNTIPHTTLVALSPDTGIDPISAACPGTGGSITGTVNLDSLDDDFIELVVPSGVCADTPVTLRVPKDQVEILSSPSSG